MTIGNRSRMLDSSVPKKLRSWSKLTSPLLQPDQVTIFSLFVLHAGVDSGGQPRLSR
jgi:hypothetical protein